MENDERRYMTVLEAAAYMNVSERLLREMITRRQFPVIRFTRKVIIDRLDLEQFMEANKEQ